MKDLSLLTGYRMKRQAPFSDTYDTHLITVAVKIRSAPPKTSNRFASAPGSVQQVPAGPGGAAMKLREETATSPALHGHAAGSDPSSARGGGCRNPSPRGKSPGGGEMVTASGSRARQRQTAGSSWPQRQPYQSSSPRYGLPAAPSARPCLQGHLCALPPRRAHGDSARPPAGG